MYPKLRLSRKLEKQLIEYMMENAVFYDDLIIASEEKIHRDLGIPLDMQSEDFCKWDPLSRVIQFSPYFDVMLGKKDELVILLNPYYLDQLARMHEKADIYSPIEDKWY